MTDPMDGPRRWRVHTRPLRTSHDFRMIWWSGLISYVGSITTYVAVPFPFLAVGLGAPWAVGLLCAAPAVGELLVSRTSGWTSHVHRHGLARRAARAGAEPWQATGHGGI